MRLARKIALVTGGTSGIGLATARAFIDHGATVYVLGRDPDRLAAAAEDLGAGAIPLAGDVASAASMEACFAAIRGRHDRLDIVVANAGIGGKAYLGHIDQRQIDELFGVDVTGVILTVQGALPFLAAGASVILVGGIIAQKGYAGWTVYSAAKAAVRSFARTWASELGPRGIRVNVLTPGVIETPSYERMGFAPEQRADFFRLTESITPLQRNGTPRDITGAMLFLASDDSAFMSGSELFVDGGTAQV